MYIGILLRLIFGYVRVEVEGYYIERFINICQNKKILIWNLKRQKGVNLYLNIFTADVLVHRPLVISGQNAVMIQFHYFNKNNVPRFNFIKLDE